MFYRLRFLLILAAVPAGAQVVIPDTPAGHTFKEWLEAFNSGDRERMDAYYRSTSLTCRQRARCQSAT